ncbi:MAG: EamA family transporter [Spirochaetaceae bacterium]
MTLIYMLIMCILTSSGQILVKKGINKGNKRYYLEPYIITGGLLIVIAPMLYLKVLSRIGLTNAYGLNGLSYLIIYFMSIVFLKEKGSVLQTVGIICITIGVLIWSI